MTKNIHHDASISQLLNWRRKKLNKKQSGEDNFESGEDNFERSKELERDLSLHLLEEMILENADGIEGKNEIDGRRR